MFQIVFMVMVFPLDTQIARWAVARDTSMSELEESRNLLRESPVFSRVQRQQSAWACERSRTCVSKAQLSLEL